MGLEYVKHTPLNLHRLTVVQHGLLLGGVLDKLLQVSLLGDSCVRLQFISLKAWTGH